MKNSIQHLTIRVTIPAIILILMFVSMNINLSKDYSKGIIESDGKGYYAYLPAVFIYKDLNFGFFDSIEMVKYYKKDLFYDYRYTYNGYVINKYYAGTALCLAPFFILGHAITLLSHNTPDGYSKYYTLMLQIGVIFYLALSLYFLKKLLSLYHLRDGYVSLILFSLVFGTNLFYYTIIEFSMSHVYSFAFITMFLYFLKRYFTNYDKRSLPLLGALLGIIALIRPVNLLIIFITPFMADQLSHLTQGLKSTFKSYPFLFLGITFFLLIFGIQFIIYLIQTDHCLIYSYANEGFNFLRPQIIKILFSYKKGLFVYTPLLLISLAGGYFLFRKNIYQFFSLFAFLGLIIFVFSSWWMWYYGGSFSSRVFIEYYSVFAILLGLTLENLRSRICRVMYISLIVIFILVCQIQTYQYRYNIIHWSEMNKNTYWDVFLRIDQLLKK
ncbi:MAG: hypothetical protein NT175_07540 [Bacteroidetes bacterium]|nr:hypothetical protein [Bacteroidota bacterium]